MARDVTKMTDEELNAAIDGMIAERKAAEDATRDSRINSMIDERMPESSRAHIAQLTEERALKAGRVKEAQESTPDERQARIDAMIEERMPEESRSHIARLQKMHALPAHSPEDTSARIDEMIQARMPEESRSHIARLKKMHALPAHSPEDTSARIDEMIQARMPSDSIEHIARLKAAREASPGELQAQIDKVAAPYLSRPPKAWGEPTRMDPDELDTAIAEAEAKLKSLRSARRK
jgi:hypothetical protein